MMSLNAPQWRFRCPLCLKRLVLPEQLVVFKPASANVSDEREDSKVIDCTTDFMQEVRDFVGHLGDNIPGGVFVSHVNCEAKHPWLTTRTVPGQDGKPPSEVREITIPGDEDAGETCDVQFTCWKTNRQITKTIQHWIVRMLHETYKHSKKHEAMWFPYLLLTATAASDEMNSSRPCGNLVELAGTRDVGKTILTVQLMHEELFGRLSDGRRIKSFEYFFPRGTSGKSFPIELYTFSAWKEQPTFRPLGTEPTPGDLRAIFIERVGRSGKASDGGGQSGPEEKDDGWLRKALRSLRGLVTEARVNLVDEEPVAPTIVEPFIPKPSQQWVPILFYDSAGESQETRAGTIRRLRDLTNKLAICVDGQELIDPEKEKTSIRHACSRLDDLTHERYRHRSTCIVVTKTDLIENTLSRQDQKSLYSKAGTTTSRDLLSRLLANGGTDDMETLLNYMSREGPERIIDDVFFVSTRGLPWMRGIRLSPIGSFDPSSATSGERVKLNAGTGYKFKVAVGEVTEDEKGEDVVILRVKQVLIHEQPVDFEIVDSDTIMFTAPSNDSCGFIEIDSENWAKAKDGLVEDQANSERLFNAATVGARETLKPRSLGLIPFLAWCGEIEESDIVRDARGGFGEDRKQARRSRVNRVGVA